MDVRDIQCFLTTCETLNFTKTARKLYMSQQGVSRIIGKLEEELGVPLLYRRNQSLVLSEYGEEFKKTANEMLSALDRFDKTVNDFKSEKRFKINMAIPAGMLYSFPLKEIKQYMDKHPEVDVFVKEYQDYQCEDALLNGDVDVAICFKADNPSLRVHLERFENTYVMVSTENPLSQKDEVTIEELKNEKFLSIAEANICGGEFIRQCIDSGFEPKTVFRSSDVSLLHMLCSQNLGVTFYIGPYPTSIPGVKILRFKDTSIKWNEYLVSDRSKKLDDKVIDFVETIKTAWE